MKTYQSYEADTGRIVRTLNIEPYMKNLYEEHGELLAEGDGDGRTHYVDVSRTPPAVAGRPEMRVVRDRESIAADGTDAVSLSGLPQPCRVRIGGSEYDVPDGTLEWATLMPGTYAITVSAWPYRDWEGEVTALADRA